MPLKSLTQNKLTTTAIVAGVALLLIAGLLSLWWRVKERHDKRMQTVAAQQRALAHTRAMADEMMGVIKTRLILSDSWSEALGALDADLFVKNHPDRAKEMADRLVAALESGGHLQGKPDQPLQNVDQLLGELDDGNPTPSEPEHTWRSLKEFVAAYERLGKPTRLEMTDYWGKRFRGVVRDDVLIGIGSCGANGRWENGEGDDIVRGITPAGYQFAETQNERLLARYKRTINETIPVR